jgi:hypothetical protein
MRRSRDAPVGPSYRRQYRSYRRANADKRGALDLPPNASETAPVKRQLSLFPSHPTLPSRPFARWSRKLDEIRVCSKCGRQIIARRRTANGEQIDEFMAERGECLRCHNCRV